MPPNRAEVITLAASLFPSYRATGHTPAVAMDQAIDAAILMLQKVDQRLDPTLAPVRTLPTQQPAPAQGAPPPASQGHYPPPQFPSRLGPEHFQPGTGQTGE